MEPDRNEKTVLDRFFDHFTRGDSLLILTHDHPDPDSISSAAALREIARVLGNAKTTVAYGGIIGRSENSHMVKYLKLDLKPIDRVKVENFSAVALVDTQPRTGNNSLPRRRIPDIVIDHHPMISPTKMVPFADIRTEYGATASILVEYLFHFGLDIDRNLGTALLYGIKSETQDLGREAKEVDIDAYLKLFPLANKKLLAKIVNSRVHQSYFQWLLSAIQNAEIAGNAIVSRLGRVDTPDMIPEIADLLLRTEGMVWTFCIGAYEEGIYLSIRTTNHHMNAGKLMKRLVKGRGTGGGHGLIAGGRIQARGMEPWEVHELETKIQDEFLRLINRGDKPRVPLVGSVEAKKKSRSLNVVGS